MAAIQTYLIQFPPDIARQQFTAYWDRIRPTDDWFGSFSNSIFVTTDLTSRQISDLIDLQFGQKSHFVTRVTQDSWGRAPEEHWKRTKPYPKGTL